MIIKVQYPHGRQSIVLSFNFSINFTCLLVLLLLSFRMNWLRGLKLIQLKLLIHENFFAYAAIIYNNLYYVASAVLLILWYHIY